MGHLHPGMQYKAKLALPACEWGSLPRLLGRPNISPLRRHGMARQAAASCRYTARSEPYLA